MTDTPKIDRERVDRAYARKAAPLVFELLDGGPDARNAEVALAADILEQLRGRERVRWLPVDLPPRNTPAQAAARRERVAENQGRLETLLWAMWVLSRDADIERMREWVEKVWHVDLSTLPETSGERKRLAAVAVGLPMRDQRGGEQ